MELVRKQAELKYLDETSRKELNAPVAELLPAKRRCPKRTRSPRPTAVWRVRRASKRWAR